MSMSRIDLRGARINSRRILPSGRTNPKTLTSLGTSWAVIPGAKATRRTVTTANRLNNLLVSTLDTGIAAKYTGARFSSSKWHFFVWGAKGERVKKNGKLITGAAFVAVLA